MSMMLLVRRAIDSDGSSNKSNSADGDGRSSISAASLVSAKFGKLAFSACLSNSFFAFLFLFNWRRLHVHFLLFFDPRRCRLGSSCLTVLDFSYNDDINRRRALKSSTACRESLFCERYVGSSFDTKMARRSSSVGVPIKSVWHIPGRRS